MPSLMDLAVKYESDKLHSHSYISFYSDLFSNINPKLVLEIGIGYESLMKPFVSNYVHGSSLKMWAEYWPEATIVGVDNSAEALRGLPSSGKMRALWADQSKPENLIALIGEIGRPDVIIDDGSHETEHQIITAIALGPYLRAGGVYIIEDVREPKVLEREIGGTIVQFNKRPDDCLVFFHR